MASGHTFRQHSIRRFILSRRRGVAKIDGDADAQEDGHGNNGEQPTRCGHWGQVPVSRQVSLACTYIAGNSASSVR